MYTVQINASVGRVFAEFSTYHALYICSAVVTLFSEEGPEGLEQWRAVRSLHVVSVWMVATTLALR
jgi:hypothetical protein